MSSTSDSVSTKKISFIVASFLGIVLLPLIGVYVKMKGDVPPDFFQFPPTTLNPAEAKAPFSWGVFVFIASLCVLICMMYLVPTLFGWKKVTAKKRPDVVFKKRKIPVWFWIGIPINLLGLIPMWAKFDSGPLLNWALVPLFWGFIFMQDGLVYYVSRGRSLFATRPQILVAIAVSSALGWLFYEYMNFFINENWYYPAGANIKPEIFLIYSSLGSTALLTMALQWFMLLLSMPKLRVKYTKGPKLQFSKKVWIFIMVCTGILLFLNRFYPNQLFGVFWLLPAIFIMCALEIAGIWSPFTPLKDGDWSALSLPALASFIQGFVYEGWNYYSAQHIAGEAIPHTENPAFWLYDIPYVNAFHIFEMPVLGFWGYFPFGIYCYVFWVAFAYITAVDPKKADLRTVFPLDEEYETIVEGEKEKVTA